MNIISTTTEKLSQFNSFPLVLMDNTYPTGSIELVKRVVDEYEGHNTTTLTMIIKEVENG